MITGQLKQSSTYSHLDRNPIWKRSFDWLNDRASTASLGIYHVDESRSKEWIANVHSYTTKPAVHCVWENHRKTIDIQYVLEGSEGIDWCCREEMGNPSSYQASNDREEFMNPEFNTNRLNLSAGHYVIFLPGETHRPMSHWSEPSVLKKVVIKIPVQLIPSIPCITNS